MSMRSLTEVLLSSMFLMIPLQGGQTAAERSVDPTFLRCSLSDLQERPVDLTTQACHYKPIFGQAAPWDSIVKGIARFGEVTVDPGGSSKVVEYPREEQVYIMLEGTGTLLYRSVKVPLRKNDFVYLPPGIPHGLSASSGSLCRFLVTGFRLPQGIATQPQQQVEKANLDEVPKQTVAGHPPTVLYQLMVGDLKSTRDKIAAGRVLTSIYIMEFASGGTNFPHHHEQEEEIYLVLDGHGEMVAGGGLTGVEGRHAARAGDAYFFRLNCTAGFYNSDAPGGKTRILGIRSLFPFPQN